MRYPDGCAKYSELPAICKGIAGTVGGGVRRTTIGRGHGVAADPCALEKRGKSLESGAIADRDAVAPGWNG
jgi:hypothetical protein